MLRRHALAYPVGPAVARGVERARFAEGPGSSLRSEERTHKARVHIAGLHVNTSPSRAAVRRIQQVRARLVLFPEQVDASLADQPPMLFVREIEVAHSILCRAAHLGPSLSAIARGQEHAFAANRPSPIAIQKID